jgi:hypothetical protein
VKIRKLEERDLPRLRELHRESGFDYPLPDFLAPEFERVTVVVDENDVPVQMTAARKTVEIYAIVDPNWRNPRWRLDALLQSHEEMRQGLLESGYEDVHAWLPPEVEKSFGRRLVGIFGWIPSRWKSYSRRLKD